MEYFVLFIITFLTTHLTWDRIAEALTTPMILAKTDDFHIIAINLQNYVGFFQSFAI